MADIIFECHDELTPIPEKTLPMAVCYIFPIPTYRQSLFTKLNFRVRLPIQTLFEEINLPIVETLFKPTNF